MDPVTITATVITFATAVKDLVELGQKIHESFAKVSKNRRNAQRTAENIKEMTEDIQRFCQARKDTLANMEEFSTALDGLLIKLRDFEESILPLVPQKRGFWKSAAFQRGWWDNNKIEEEILDLARDVRAVTRKYTMNSTMRIEAKQESNHQHSTQQLEGISHVIGNVGKAVSALRLTETAARASSEAGGTTEGSVIKFALSSASTSAPMLRVPDEFMDDRQYIVSQIRRMAAGVEKISTLRVSDPSSPQTLVVSFPNDASLETSDLQLTVVRELVGFRRALSLTHRRGLQSVSVEQGATFLGNLSVRIANLGMTDDAIVVGTWAMKLARRLADASRNEESQDRASLALCLCNLSKFHYQNGDMAQSRKTIEESLSITQNLLCQEGTGTEIHGLYGDALVHYAEFVSDTRSAIRMCIEAIQLLEATLGLQAFNRVDSDGISASDMQPTADFVERVISLSPTPVMVDRCATAFEDLALYLFRGGFSDSAKRLALLPVALRRKMVFVHKDDHDSDVHRHGLALTISRLCQRHLAQCFSDTEVLAMIDEGALLLRNLQGKNPIFYSQHLVAMLLKKTQILRQINKNADTISTWKEVVALTGDVLQDFKLQTYALLRLAEKFHDGRRYQDAVHTMTLIPPTSPDFDVSQAWLYERISYGLLRISCYRQSAEAAKRAVGLYRELCRMNQDRLWQQGLVASLTTMAQSLISLGDNTQGFSALEESACIAGNVLNANLCALPTKHDQFIDALVNEVKITLLHGENSETSLDSSSFATQRLERLAKDLPQNTETLWGLTQAQMLYVNHLYRVGRLEDALQYIDQWQDGWSTRTTPDQQDNGKFASCYMIWMTARILDAQSLVKAALEDIGKVEPQPPAVDQPMLLLVVCMVQRIQFHVNLGNWHQAREVAVCALSRARFGSAAPGIWALFGDAYAALADKNYQRALESAGKAIALSDDAEWKAEENEDDVSIRPRLFAIMSSAEANTGNPCRALKYAQQSVVLSLDIAERKHAISSITATHSLMETRGYLAEVRLAIGDLIQARQICEERVAYFRERVKSRIGEYRDLAPSLRMLGVLFCHKGRHNEGETAARELTEMINRLGLGFPCLQEQVKIRLRYQASVPILKVLDEMTEKLDCEHQKGITALFKD